MLFLVVEHSKGNIEVLSPNNYGMDTWGMSTQEGLKQKEDGWYTTYWSDGGQWLEDINEEDKLNVLLETTDIDKLLSFILAYKYITLDSVKIIVQQIKEIVDDTMMWFEHMYLSNEDN